MERLTPAVQEAVEAHFSGDADAVPQPTPLELLVGQADYVGGVWMLVDLDLSRIDSQPVRLNVSRSSHLVQQIDAWAKAHQMTRSGFMASAVTQAMATLS